MTDSNQIANFDLSTLLNPLYGFSPADQELLRRCASVQIYDEDVFQRVLRADLDDAMSLEALAGLYFVDSLPGKGKRYRLRDSTKVEIFDSWWHRNPQAANESLDSVPPALGTLSEQLAAYYAAEGNRLDQLYHLVLVDQEAAADLLVDLFDEADRQFDLTSCAAILRLMEDRPERLLSPALRDLVVRKRVQLDTRAMWASEYRETIPYVERNETENLLDELLADPERWILNMHAPGGMGKSMYVRATLARRCVLEDIPCAKIDFDFVPHMANVAREPWRLLLGIAQQLTRQLPHNPFQELLTYYAAFAAESGSRPILAPRDFAGSDLSDGEKRRLRDDILNRFVSVLKSVDAPVLLVFDTLENLLHRNVDLQQLFVLLEDLHVGHSRIRVILAGRLDLSEHIPQPAGDGSIELSTDFAQRFAGQHIAVRLSGFEEQEAFAYLADKRGMGAADPRVPVMIAKARIQENGQGGMGISPFKLALLSDIVRVHPEITAAEFDRYEDVDLAHLVERVVNRIQDDRVKWLVRYGIVPRLLTRAMVKELLVPFMVLGMAGQAESDDAAQDPIVEPQLDSSPFPVVDGDLRDVDAGALWERLYRYTAEYSWVSTDEAAGALRFHPDVVEPMRRLLRKHQAAGRPILVELQRACVDYFENTATTSTEQRALWLAEAVYHKLQSGDEDADAYWLRLMDGTEEDGESVMALAGEALHEPPAFDESAMQAAAEAPRFGPDVLARAHYEVAKTIVDRKGLLTEEDVDRIDDHAMEAERLNNAGSGLIHDSRLAYLHARVAAAQGNHREVEDICRLALARPADRSNQLDLCLLFGETLASTDRREATGEFERAVSLATEVGGERLNDAMRGLIKALEFEENFERAADVCADWRQTMGADAGADLIGENVLTHMNQYLAMGQEKQAASLGAAELTPGPDASNALAGSGEMERRLQAAVHLAKQDVVSVLSVLERGEGPTSSAIGTAQDEPFETALRARIYADLVDVVGARSAMEAMAWRIHGVQTKQGIQWLLRLCQLNIELTGNLIEADGILSTAQENAQDVESQIRCELVQIQLLTFRGQADEARSASQVLAAREDLPPSPTLRLLVALEVVIQDGGGEAWTALLEALKPVAPASRRLLLLWNLWRCPTPEPISPIVASRLSVLVPELQLEGSHAPLVSLRLAEVNRILGRVGRSRQLLRFESHMDRDGLVLMRQTFLALDRLGWDQDLLRDIDFDELQDQRSSDTDALIGLMLLEHSERLVQVMGGHEAATQLLDRAEIGLKASAGLWAARIVALRARIAALQGDRQQAADLFERAAKLFGKLGDRVSVERAMRERDTLLYVGVESPSHTVMSAGDVVGGLESLVQPESVVPRWTVDLRSEEQSDAGRRWAIEYRKNDAGELNEDVFLSDEFSRWIGQDAQDEATRRGETVPARGTTSGAGATTISGHPFVRAFQDDWQAVALQMGDHLFPQSARGFLASADGLDNVDLEVNMANYGWLPWELIRLDEASQPFVLEERCRRFYRRANSSSYASTTPTVASEATSALIVRLGVVDANLGTRSGAAMGSVDPSREYRNGQLDYLSLEHPGADELRKTILETHPAVVHIVSNLVETQAGVELVFGSRRNLSKIMSQTRSRGGDLVETLSVNDLSRMIASLTPSPLVVLDVPPPPVQTERINQLFLRNAFAAQWTSSAYTPPAAILAAGLGDGMKGRQAAELLVDGLREELPIGEIADRIRSVDKATGVLTGTDGDPLELPFLAGTALFADDPDQIFRVSTL